MALQPLKHPAPKTLKCSPECPGDQTCDHAKYCMCGSRMEDHDIGSGHSPVSMHDYYRHEGTE